METSLTVTVTQKKAGVYIIAPVGSIDSMTYSELEKKFQKISVPPPTVLVLNMEGVTYLSSVGISTIFKMRKLVEGNGGVFLMTDLKPQIKKVFEVIKVLPGLNVFASIKEIDDYLARIQRGDM